MENANDTDRMWELWGRQDPYYGVLSADKFRSESIDEHRDEFFHSGAWHVETVLQSAEKRFGRLPRNSVLDFGCGVGRLVIPFASEFQRVVGLDISESMLSEAQANLDSRSISNVELYKSDDALTKLADKRFDLVHTVMVLQHIPVDRGYVIIQNLLNRVSDNGAFYIQFSVKRVMSLPKEIAYFARHNIPAAGSLISLFSGKRISEPSMQMNEYDLLYVLKVFKECGFNQTTLEFREHNGLATVACFGVRE